MKRDVCIPVNSDRHERLERAFQEMKKSGYRKHAVEDFLLLWDWKILSTPQTYVFVIRSGWNRDILESLSKESVKRAEEFNGYLGRQLHQPSYLIGQQQHKDWYKHAVQMYITKEWQVLSLEEAIQTALDSFSNDSIHHAVTKRNDWKNLSIKNALDYAKKVSTHDCKLSFLLKWSIISRDDCSILKALELSIDINHFCALKWRLQEIEDTPH